MRYLSQIETIAMHKVYTDSTENLKDFILWAFGAPVLDYCVKQKMGHSDLCRYLRSHIHLVNERDLEGYLDEDRS